MTVVNPKSISGINSITMASGSDDLLTIHSNNTTERVRVNNSGDVIIGSGVTLSPDGDIFATGITTISENLKVGTGVTISPDGDGFFTGVVTATSYAGDGSALTGISVDSTQIVTGNTSVQTVDTGSDGHVKINTEGTERLRIDSSGRLGIQGAATKGILDVRASGGSATLLTAVFGANEGQSGGTLSDNTDKACRIGSYHYDIDEEPFGILVASGTNGTNNLTFGGGTSLMNTATEIKFNTAANSTTTSGTNRLTIDSSGNVEVKTGNLVIGTSGKGIDFSATGDGTSATSVAEILDDYEEGLFTPYMAYSTTQNDFAYSTQVGQYVKIGKLVTFQARVNLTSAGTGSGNVKMTNLPFAPTPSSGSLSNPMVIVKPVVGVDVGGDREIFAQFEGGASAIFLYTFGIESSSDYATFTSSNIDNDAQVAFFGHYYTDS